MKKFLNRQNVVILVVLFVAGVFMAYYPYAVKHLIVSRYKSGLMKSLNKLHGEQKKQAEETLAALEEGKMQRGKEEHNTRDFMHIEYFGEPWREWSNTIVVWEKARNFYFVFLALFSVNLLINHLRKRRNQLEVEKHEAR